MKKSEQEQHINKQFKTIEGHVKRYLKSADQEELHQFRVGVKKLRALFVFLEYGPQQHHLLRYFKPVRQIFKQAGLIRGAYINLELSNQYQFNHPEFTDQQQQLMADAHEEFMVKGKKYLKEIKQAQKNILNHIKPLANKHVLGFYRDNLIEIDTYLQKPEFNDTLHDCRKKVKFLLYNQKIANNALGKPMELNTGYLDKLQEHIGNWHDNLIAIDLLNQLGVTNKQILLKLKRRTRLLQRQIMVLSTGFMAKATGINAALSPQ